MNILILTALYILFSVGLMPVFKQMGLPAGAALVPLYNLYLLVKNTWSAAWFWILMLLCLNAAVLPMLYTANGHSLAMTTWLVQMLAGMVWLLISFHVAASFGKGALAGSLFALFPFAVIFWFERCTFAGKVPSLSNTNQKERIIPSL